MLPLARAAPFIVLFALGIVQAATRGTRYAALTRNIFIAWFFISSCAAGLLQHDFWPFSAYPVIAESARDYRSGVWYEATIDASPLTNSVFDKWVERVFVKLPPDRQAFIARFLLTHSCSNRRILGWIAAPDWMTRPHRESERIFRVYRATTNERTLVYELQSQ